jgi:hypothetical protein
MGIEKSDEIRLISSTEERTKIMNAIKEISKSMHRMADERSYINDSKKKIIADHKLPAKAVTRLVKTYHKGNFDEEIAAEEAFKALYVQVFGG